MRVIFKHEDEVNGEPFGPVFVTTAEPEPGALGRPYQTSCACLTREAERVRSTDRNEWGYPLCSLCGGEIEPPWQTRSEALRVAAEHNVELEES